MLGHVVYRGYVLDRGCRYPVSTVETHSIAVGVIDTWVSIFEEVSGPETGCQSDPSGDPAMFTEAIQASNRAPWA
jgi:hypothetical protein